MTIVAKLPVFVMQLLERYLLPIRQWLSDQIYADLVARDPTHLLVRLNTRLNLTALEQACSGFHHIEGRGAPPTHPVYYLVRALIVRYACSHISSGKVCQCLSVMRKIYCHVVSYSLSSELYDRHALGVYIGFNTDE